MSSKYTLPFLPFAFHWTILCCLVTLAWSPVNLVSQGVFPPLKVILKVSPKRFQQERVTDENVMNCTEKHFFAIWKENSWEYFKMPRSVYSDCGVTGLKKSISRPPLISLFNEVWGLAEEFKWLTEKYLKFLRVIKIKANGSIQNN